MAAEQVTEPTVTIEEPAATVVSSEPADPAEQEAEREARESGWVPKERWKGPAERWRPAKEFLDARDHVLPFVQKEVKRYKAELEAAGARIAALEKTQQEHAEQRAKLGQETLKFERQQALEAGDYAKVNDIDAKLIDAAVAAKTKQQPQQPQVDPEVNRIWTDFVAENEWATTPKMQRVLWAHLDTMRRSGTDIAGREMLDEAKDYLRRIYPDEIGTAATGRVPAMAETGGRNGSSRGGTKNWSDLKPEVREALEPMIGENGITKEALLRRCAEKPAEYFRSR